jgi:putative isomerase
LPSGMVAQIANWNHDPIPYVNVNQSNPPVASLCAWKMYQRWPDREFLAEVYSALLRWHQWWPKYSDGNHNGLLEWGSGYNSRLEKGAHGSFPDAVLACGWDDTPAFDGAEMIGTQMNADAVDLNSLWSMDAQYLSYMAEELGLKSDAAELRQQQAHINSLINDVLWNEELGVYCSRLWNKDGSPGKFLTRLTPMNFYPLICGAPDEQRAQRVLETLTNPAKFWGRWPIPTLAYDDPLYPQQEYWHGHTWAPVNYLLWQGVRRYGTQQQKHELAQRSVELFMRNWTEFGTCNENFKSTDGSGDDRPHYTWGALLCQIGIEYCYDADAHGGPATSKEVGPIDIDLRNMPSGGSLYRIRSYAGGWNVELERQ